MVKWQGRLLASEIDPQDEASEWLARRQHLIGSARSVFVLGLGGGYHVSALRAAVSARIIVVEAHKSIAAEYAEVVERVVVVNPASPKELWRTPAVREALSHSYSVLDHRPSVATHPEFYRECGDFLRARHWGALTWIWRMRGLPDLDPQSRVGQGSSPLSIKDLLDTELARRHEARESLLVHALGELVR